MLTTARSPPGTIGSMLAVPSQLGYPVVFGLIFGESAGGRHVPGLG
jgi:hypothetical protein